MSMSIECVTAFQNSFCCVMSCGGGRMEGHWTVPDHSRMQLSTMDPVSCSSKPIVKSPAQSWDHPSWCICQYITTNAHFKDRYCEKYLMFKMKR